MGQHMNRIGTRRDKTASGYVTESARYKAQRCEGCPLRGSCFKARGNRIIEVNHRLNQYTEQVIDLSQLRSGYYPVPVPDTGIGTLVTFSFRFILNIS